MRWLGSDADKGGFLYDGKLFYSPIGDNPQKIIDLGTETGNCGLADLA